MSDDRDRDAVAAACAAAGFSDVIDTLRPLGGGGVSRVVRVAPVADRPPLVAKLEPVAVLPRFEAEARGLAVLADTGTVPVPAVATVGAFADRAVLLEAEIPAATPTTAGWVRLGRDLAALHRAGAGHRYGFDHDNHLGATPQVNTPHDDWVEFNAGCRLGPQVRRARDGGRLTSDEARRMDDVIARLDRHLPRRPVPALLHGDLWSGNALPTTGDRVAVIDPACSIGDGWADIAMMRLFGGFPETCFDAYADALGEIPGDLDARLDVYRLYHVLNHVNLFGRGYVGQALALAARL